MATSFYRLWHRVEREFAVVSGDSADDACRSIGWRVGDVWVRPLRNPTIAEIEEEQRLLESVSPLQDDRQGERGQALIETAILLPLACFFVVGALCLALCVSDHASISFAGRTAATWAARQVPWGEVDVCARTLVNTSMLTGIVGCTAVWSADSVEVSMSYPESLPFADGVVLRSVTTVYR